jgi:2-C-methyl-D-erythritol 4-phosphate cytidylyltransferase
MRGEKDYLCGRKFKTIANVRDIEIKVMTLLPMSGTLNKFETLEYFFMKRYTIIVAGGQGKRMNAAIPKQFLLLAGKPVLMHTLEVFSSYNNEMEIILVLPENQMEVWFSLCREHSFDVAHSVVAGGSERFYSVKNALNAVETPSLVAVHDGVRPLVSRETIDRCFAMAEKQQTAVPVVDLVDSIREISDSESRAVDRNRYKLVQTPQVFSGELLKRAYEAPFSPTFTDDASVVESLGKKISLVEGNRENIKLTTEMDLKIAECLID